MQSITSEFTSVTNATTEFYKQFRSTRQQKTLNNAMSLSQWLSMELQSVLKAESTPFMCVICLLTTLNNLVKSITLFF